jgi:hypothetical protein
MNLTRLKQHEKWERIKAGTTCPYCFKASKLIPAVYVYGYKNKLNGKYVRRCKKCDALVGCHGYSKKAMGILAKPNVRILRKKAHEEFDYIWQYKIKRENCSKKHARQLAYEWLANQLDVELEDCHISQFFEFELKETIRICSKYVKKIKKFLRNNNGEIPIRTPKIKCVSSYIPMTIQFIQKSING